MRYCHLGYSGKIKMEDQLIFTDCGDIGEISAILISDERLWIVEKVDQRKLVDNPDKLKQKANPYNAGVKEYLLSDIERIRYCTNELFVKIKIGKKNLRIQFHKIDEANNFVGYLSSRLGFSKMKKRYYKAFYITVISLAILFTIYFMIDFLTATKEELLIEKMNTNPGSYKTIRGINLSILLHDKLGNTWMTIIYLAAIVYLVYLIYKEVKNKAYKIVCQKP